MKMTSMRSLTVAAMTAAALLTLGEVVQSPAQNQQAPPMAASKLNLTMEQRHVIKEIIKEQKVAGATADVKIAVGTTVPSSVELRAMPADVSSQVSHVKSHLYFVKNQQIVIVDSKTNQIVEVIE